MEPSQMGLVPYKRPQRVPFFPQARTCEKTWPVSQERGSHQNLDLPAPLSGTSQPPKQ